jgi:predicted glutamine amidotransferase
VCLIIAKPIGKKMPSIEKLDYWFASHKDGAGVMFNDAMHKVHILKGAMTITELHNLQDKMVELIKPLIPAQVNIVWHFRQATEGTIKPQNCHPFPVTSNKNELASLELITNRAIAHNGIIWDYGEGGLTDLTNKDTDDTTDTQKFIEKYLSRMGKAVFNQGVRNLIAEYTQSRFAILDETSISFIGEFIQDNGLYFSNSGYKEVKLSPILANYNYTDSIYAKEYKDWNKMRYKDIYQCDYCGNVTDRLYDVGDGLVCESCVNILDDFDKDILDEEVV